MARAYMDRPRLRPGRDYLKSARSAEHRYEKGYHCLICGHRAEDHVCILPSRIKGSETVDGCIECSCLTFNGTGKRCQDCRHTEPLHYIRKRVTPCGVPWCICAGYR